MINVIFEIDLHKQQKKPPRFGKGKLQQRKKPPRFGKGILQQQKKPPRFGKSKLQKERTSKEIGNNNKHKPSRFGIKKNENDDMSNPSQLEQSNEPVVIPESKARVHI